MFLEREREEQSKERVRIGREQICLIYRGRVGWSPTGLGSEDDLARKGEHPRSQTSRAVLTVPLMLCNTVTLVFIFVSSGLVLR